jgi:lipooligosaccharide transport system permease protein
LPALTGMVMLHLAWIIVVTAIFCIVAINLMRRRLIV